jgi:NDP-sugar pyrophosphorylase family protein
MDGNLLCGGRMASGEDGLTLVVLAAGIGSRYGGLKQMDPVGPSGEFLLDYAAYDALRAGFACIVFIVRRDMADDFRAVVGARIGQRADTRYVFQDLSALPSGFSVPPERQKPWGTGHAILCAREAVRGPFVTINADDFYGAQSYASLAAFLRETAADSSFHGMVGYPLRPTLSDHGTVARGICRVGADALLGGVEERTALSPAGLRDQGLTGEEVASMNIWGFKPSVFDHLEEGFKRFLRDCPDLLKREFFVPDVVNDIVRRGMARVKVLPTRESWLGMTNREDRGLVVARIRDLVRAGVYPERLWGGA